MRRDPRIEAAYEAFLPSIRPEAFEDYRREFQQEIGEEYLVGAAPAFVTEKSLEKIAATVEAVVRFLKSPTWEAECRGARAFLAYPPMKDRDYFGCVDFHLGAEGPKIVETNFHTPGLIGYHEVMERHYFAHFHPAGRKGLSRGFYARLAEEAIGGLGGGKLAVAVNHLASSDRYRRHYAYLAKALRATGIEAKVVEARDAAVGRDGCPSFGGEHFDSILSTLIPCIWEANAAAFGGFSEVLRQCPDRFIPNPFAFKLGYKGNLVAMNRLERYAPELESGDRALLGEATLRCHFLSEFADYEAFRSEYPDPSQLVLKPFENYGGRGVRISPSEDELARCFQEQKSQLIVQELYMPEKIPFMLPDGSWTNYHYQIRAVFLHGHFVGIVGYAWVDETCYLIPLVAL